MKKLMIIAAAAALVGIGTTATLYGFGNDDILQGAFPNRIHTTIALPADAQGIDQTVFQLADDNWTPAFANIDFKNGDTGENTYRPDGTLAHREVFYGQLPDGSKQLRWRAEYAADGVTYTTDAGFWPNGSRKRVGDRLEDGSYLIVTYFEDGITEQERSLIAADGSGLFQRVKHLDGTLAYFGRKTDKAIEETVYTESGKKLRFTSRNMFRSQVVEYYPDTDVVKSDIVSDTYDITMLSYDPTGRMSQKVVIETGILTVIYFPDGAEPYQQKWLRTNHDEAKKGAPSTWRIYSVARVDAAEKPHFEFWFQTDPKFTTNVPWFSYESLDGKPTETSGDVLISRANDSGCLVSETKSTERYAAPYWEKTYSAENGECVAYPMPTELMHDLPFVPPNRVPESKPHYS